ncbi:MAG: DUF2892 domain-containing protein [Ghiorsea sp.]
MTVERIIHVVAGLFIMLSVVLSSVFNGVNLMEPTWLWFALFVGVNLFQSGFSQWCLMATMLKKVGFKSEASACKSC